MIPSGMKANDWQHFQEMLPWYVNGTLGAGARQEMLHLLATYPECAAELKLLESLAKEIRDQPLPLNDERGLDRLMAMVRAQTDGKLSVIGSANVARRPDAPERKESRQLPVFGIAATVLIALTAAFIVQFLHNEDPATLRPLGAAEISGNREVIQATFRATASEAQIRGLLSTVGAEIVSGPGAIGVYVLRVPNGRVDSAMLELQQATGLVDSATLLAK